MLSEELDPMVQRGRRENLVRELKKKGIVSEAVLQAIRAVPRHLFFQKDFQKFAYEDQAFPIDLGQTISQPYTVAYQSSLLEIKPGDKVLEIGTGSGYQACVLAALGAKVYSVEILADLQKKAAQMFKKLNTPVELHTGDGSLGWPEHAPYDGIIVTAGAPSVPKPLLNQLAVGGKLIIPVGKTKNDQQMIRMIKKGPEEFETQKLSMFRFVPLTGKLGWGTE